MNDYYDSTLSRKYDWKMIKKAHEKKLKAISAGRSRIDNYYDPMRSKNPNLVATAGGKREVRRENKRLLKSLAEIVKAPPMHRKFVPVSVPKPASRNSVDKLRKIKEENDKQARSLRQVKSNYSLKQWKQQFKSSREYFKIRSKPHISLKPKKLLKTTALFNDLHFGVYESTLKKIT